MLSPVRFLDSPDDDVPLIAGREPDAPMIVALPFVLPDPRSVPPREWLYGRHYIRRYVSASVAPGGIGKTALSVAEALAIATGRDLLGVRPADAAKVWFLSLEDPADEFARRMVAACKRYDIQADEIAGRIFVTSARDSTVTVATTTKAGTTISRPIVEAIVELARSVQLVAPW
jgi:hypothetical protein